MQKGSQIAKICKFIKVGRYKCEWGTRGQDVFSVANSYFVNPAIGIQMSAYDLLSGTLTFLLFVILTPFVGAGSHAASVSVYSAVRLHRRNQPRLDCRHRHRHRTYKNYTTKRLHIIIVYI